MKTKNKVVLLALCMAALIVASVLGTMAYLTSQDTVTNTFTIGNVQIKLDETQVDTSGAPVIYEDTGADKAVSTARVQENEYKLVPGHNYTKDPMVTVLDGSEESYIKMTVTFSEAAALDAIFAPTGADLTSIFIGYDSTIWIDKGNTEDTTANTRTYEFWYKETVEAPDGDVELDPLFDSFTVPGEITNAQLATIEGMTITVNAYAIQADGFADAADAWNNFN